MLRETPKRERARRTRFGFRAFRPG
jgi:hypothetical protein